MNPDAVPTGRNYYSDKFEALPFKGQAWEVGKTVPCDLPDALRSYAREVTRYPEKVSFSRFGG